MVSRLPNTNAVAKEFPRFGRARDTSSDANNNAFAHERTYKRREPEKTVLYETIQNHFNTFLEGSDKNRSNGQYSEPTPRNLPKYVLKEFEGYLGCGILANGFVRVKCGDCPHEKLVAFSCKKRGFCPSCGGRKMSESAAFLTDYVLPNVQVRQFVLSMPIQLRYFMARQPKLTSDILTLFIRAVSGYLKKKARIDGVTGDLEAGSVTVIQRSGGAVNLNIHFHTLFLEGVFAIDDTTDTPKFYKVMSPSNDEIKVLLETIQKRIVRLLRKRGLIPKEVSAEDGYSESHNEHEQTFFEINDDAVVAAAMEASVASKIAFGENSGDRVKRLGSFGNIFGNTAKLTGRRCADLGGFSLHANVSIKKNARDKLEKLCRYIARPAIALERLYYTESGNVGYRFKKEWSDGTHSVSFTPTEFIEKLIAIIPQARIHLTRFHGILAPNSKFRSMVVPQTVKKDRTRPTVPVPDDDEQSVQAAIDAKDRKLKWADLLKRVFQIDIQICPDCGGQLRIIASVMERVVIKKILTHLDLPTMAPVLAPAKSPPKGDRDQSQFWDYEFT